jgi:hypothetical protein
MGGSIQKSKTQSVVNLDEAKDDMLKVLVLSVVAIAPDRNNGDRKKQKF